jgi:hypothetical protein
MTPRRLLFVLAAVLVVVNRRAIVARVVRWTGTNVHTERAGGPAA